MDATALTTAAPCALAVHRFASGMTQSDLAAKARLSRAAIANLESGKSQPRRLTAESIARALGVPVADLFSPNDLDPAGTGPRENSPVVRRRDER